MLILEQKTVQLWPVDVLIAIFRQRIGTRIALALATGLFLSLAVAGVSIYYLAEVGQSLRDISERNRLLFASIIRLAEAVEQQSDGVSGLLLAGDEGHLEFYAAGRREFEDALADLEALMPPGPGSELLQTVSNRRGRFEQAAQNEVAMYRGGQPRTAAFIWQGEGLQSKASLLDAIDELMSWQDQITREGMEESRRQEWLAALLALGLVAVASALGIVVGLRLTRGITTRIGSLVKAAEIIKSGEMDTSIQVEGEDELASLAQALARMVAAQRKSRFSLERVLLQTERRNRELLTMNAVAATVSASLNLQEILDSTISKLVELTEADAGQITLLLDDRSLRSVALKPTACSDDTENPSSTFDSGLALIPVGTRRHVVIADLATDSRFREHPMVEAGFHSLVCAALMTRDQMLGTVSLTSRSPDRFDQADASLLALVGQQVGVAVENSRLYERSAEFAAVAERNRLAREIHDTLAQGLAGIILQLEAADQLIGTNVERGTFRLRKALELTRESLAEARRSVWNLRPAPLEEKTLDEALRCEGARFQDETGVSVRIEVDGETGELPRDIENGLLRIAQEALTNVRKHAHANSVLIRLGTTEHEVLLRVQDDGVGFDGSPPAHDQGGFGLVGLRERAVLLGGELTIQSAEGAGTTIHAVVPLGSRRRPQESPANGGLGFGR
ncbi:MAG: GAF domain-containing protein [Chloroflexota bacterium]|nr:MAG: GAF domain-containing protein [Chloroflexota bacterium]